MAASGEESARRQTALVNRSFRRIRSGDSLCDVAVIPCSTWSSDQRGTRSSTKCCIDRMYPSVTRRWTARATGQDIRIRELAGRENAVIAKTTVPSSEMLAMNASSPSSGCPGSVPYANPHRPGSSTISMTRQGAAIALRGGADGDDHCRTGSDLCPLRQHPDAGDAVRPPHLEPLDRTIERLGPATEHDLVMIVAIPERMLAGQGRRRFGVRG